jgi:hypothetical protein
VSIWVLVLISGLNTSQIQLFVNTFDSKQKCEKRASEMSDHYKKACIKTEVNK